MMLNKKPTVIILCGGKGMRLRPITNDLPKPLIPISGKPVLHYIINQCMKYDLDKFVIATGYKSKKISEFIDSNFRDLDCALVDSGDSDIINRIRDCLDLIDDDFILCYGDTISDINLNNLQEYHKLQSNISTVTSFPISIPFGVMSLDDDNYVKSFIEKPVLKDVMNIGYFYFSKVHHNLFFKHNSFIEVLDDLCNQKELKCYNHAGIHITINTIQELEYANANISKILK
ncbi:MAG: nucleotidyltransferase family protein [Gammaproteobacteria bacterium]|nr:nucleotidyltransferase family protein [Gammaproteobacteria bacterium]